MGLGGETVRGWVGGGEEKWEGRGAAQNKEWDQEAEDVRSGFFIFLHRGKEESHKPIGSVENTFLLYIVWFEITSQNSVFRHQCISSAFIGLLPIHWKREQRIMQCRAPLSIKQCYNLMKFVDILPTFQIFISFIPERKTGLELNTKGYIIYA